MSQMPLLLATTSSVGSFELIPKILPGLVLEEPPAQPALNLEEPLINVSLIDVPGNGEPCGCA